MLQGCDDVELTDAVDVIAEGPDHDLEDVEPSWYDNMLLKCAVSNESHRDFSHDDSMQDGSMQDDATHALDHSDEWYPWHSRAVSCDCMPAFTVIE